MNRFLFFEIFFASIFFIRGISSAVFINELNIIDPKKPEKNEFIELKSTKADISLRGYKVIGFNCKASSGTIEFVATLWNQRVNKNGLYTIGGSNVQEADLKVPNDYIKFRNIFLPSSASSLSNFLVNGNKDLNAIAILYDSEKLNPFEEITLTKKNTYIRIDDKITELLKKYTVDMVVYGQTKECDKCKLFEIIHQGFSNKKYTLREFPENANKQDISLNRCAFESTGFVPEKFKIGTPTPGRKNDCNGPHFILEDIILNIMPPVNAHSMYDNDLQEEICTNVPECTSTIETTDYLRVSTQEIQNAIPSTSTASTSNVCTSLMLNPEGGNIAQHLEQENRRKRHIGVSADHSEEPEWETKKYFR